MIATAKTYADAHRELYDALNDNTLQWPAQKTQGTSMVMSNSILHIGPAFLAAQGKMANAVKDAKNPFFKSSYADLNSVREACTPALHAEGILVMQPTIQKEGKSYVHTLLVHAKSGEFFSSDTEIVCAKQNDPQALGSAITYARRYGLQSLVSLGSADDDGESAMNRSQKIETSAPKKARTAPKPTFSQNANQASPELTKEVQDGINRTDNDGWE